MTAIIFDLDGTLLNTIEDIGDSCNYIIQQCGKPAHPIKDYYKFVGNGFEMLMQRALNPLPSNTDLAEITAAARSYYAQHMMDKTRPYPGIREVLKELSAARCKLAVLSNKPQALSSALIEHYFPDIDFIKVYGAREGVPLKPDPTALINLKTELGENTAYYAGDSNVDIKTALAGNCIPVGVSWGFREVEELIKAGAKMILTKPEDLLKLIS